MNKPLAIIGLLSGIFSSEISISILTRLQYNDNFINNNGYLLLLTGLKYSFCILLRYYSFIWGNLPTEQAIQLTLYHFNCHITESTKFTSFIDAVETTYILDPGSLYDATAISKSNVYHISREIIFVSNDKISIIFIYASWVSVYFFPKANAAADEP